MSASITAARPVRGRMRGILLGATLLSITHAAAAQPRISLTPASAPPSAQTTKPAKPSKSAKAKKRKSKSTTPSPAMSPERARAIQDALVRAGYLDHASGQWDSASLGAMKKFQADHHWQVKFAPDARALIALGLGPQDDKESLSAAPPPGKSGI